MHISNGLHIDERAIEEIFIRASGPGGQNVNKVASAVQLRLDLGRAGLPAAVRTRLAKIAGRRLNSEGVLVIEASRFRTQERNRQDARQRLAALLQRAATAPKPRRPTKPSAAAKRRRLEAKAHRSSIKAGRGRIRSSD